MPAVPRVQLPHPVAGSDTGTMRKIAELVAPTIIQALEGGDG
jgi:hypothetical protein